MMQPLLEFAPVLAFFVSYYLGGLYVATAVLMIAMLGLLAIDYLRNGKVSPMHALSAVLVLVFGGATLLLHDRRFIQWKPTVFCWLLAVVFLASHWVGARTLTERLMASALAGHVRVSSGTWHVLNSLWVAFYALLGGLNLFVAYNAPEHVWVNFKLFGLTLLTAIFVALQVLWLTRRGAAVQVERSA